MGDRTWTGIRFSGMIRESQLPKLIDAMEADQVVAWVGNGQEEPTRENIAEQFSDDECNYAELDACEAIASELGLSYHKTWASGDDYPSGQKIYLAVTGSEFETTDSEGEPMICLTELKKLGYAGALAKLEMFTEPRLSELLPPLEIIPD